MDTNMLNQMEHEKFEYPTVSRNIGVVDFNSRVYHWGIQQEEPFSLVRYTKLVWNNLIDFMSSRLINEDFEEEDVEVTVHELGKLIYEMSTNLQNYMGMMVEHFPQLQGLSYYETIKIGEKIIIRVENWKLINESNYVIYDPASKFPVIFNVLSSITNVEAIETALLSMRSPAVKEADAKFQKKAITNIWHDIRTAMEMNPSYDSWLFKVPGVPSEFLFKPLEDDDIAEVWINLYRTAGVDARLIVLLTHLVRFTKARVHVFIEVTARGNEKSNKEIAEILRFHGCDVHTNYLDLKMHMKCYLIEYKDGHRMCMIGTGNYNEDTMQHYVDYHLMTMKEAICAELFEIYSIMLDPNRSFKDHLQYFTSDDRWLYVSPISLRDRVMTLLSRAKKKVFLKCNHLCDKPLVDALRYYQHANGFQLNIACRTSCSLISTTNQGIQVRSQVGHNLEHARVYQFDDEVYIASADFLMRNMNKRIELMVRLPKNVVACVTSLEFSGIRWNLKFDKGFLNDWLQSLWDDCNFRMVPVTGKWEPIRE